MNKVALIGRLVDAPETKTTPQGTAVTRFKIAVNRKFNKDVADFIPIVAWRNLSDLCSTYLVKGQQVGVTGELHIESYTDQMGNKRSKTEVVIDDVDFLAKPSNVTAISEKKEKEAKAVQEVLGHPFLVDNEDLPF